MGMESHQYGGGTPPPQCRPAHATRRALGAGAVSRFAARRQTRRRTEPESARNKAKGVVTPFSIGFDSAQHADRPDRRRLNGPRLVGPETRNRQSFPQGHLCDATQETPSERLLSELPFSLE